MHTTQMDHFKNGGGTCILLRRLKIDCIRILGIELAH